MRIKLFLIIFCISFLIGPFSFAAVIDTDKDGLSDKIEEGLGTDMNNSDTDGDGYVDGVEVASGFNPLVGNRDRNIERHVVIDLSKQQMRYFMNGIEIGKVAVSTGVPGLDTPRGEFKIIRKVPKIDYIGINYSYKNTRWNLEFKKSFYLHGAYWHNQFGKKPMSHGCVNIAYKDAEKIYKFLDVGDVVRVVGKTPRKALALP